ncbi:MAG: transporter [Gammaproteobacteria bacterium]|nr:transporter [Gammaproteobacteria bacterium]MDH3507938.1 transporter [Gammaproteobacteria bacterium]
MFRILTVKEWGLIALVAVFGFDVASAQTIDANRPGFSFTTGTVPDGRWQLETGIAYARPGSNSRTTSLPFAELRYGVADDMELFVSSLNWARSESGSRDSSGLLDANIGIKIAAGGGERLRSAVLFQLSVPIGDSDFSSDDWDPGIAYVWAYDGRIPLVGTVMVRDSGDRYQLDNGLQLPYSINDRQTVFVEWEANLPEGGNDAHWLNGGLMWLLDDRRQIDFEAGAGLNDAAGDYRLSAGFSILF